MNERSSDAKSGGSSEARAARLACAGMAALRRFLLTIELVAPFVAASQSYFVLPPRCTSSLLLAQPCLVPALVDTPLCSSPSFPSLAPRLSVESVPLVAPVEIRRRGMHAGFTAQLTRLEPKLRLEEEEDEDAATEEEEESSNRAPNQTPLGTTCVGCESDDCECEGSSAVPGAKSSASMREASLATAGGSAAVEHGSTNALECSAFPLPLLHPTGPSILSLYPPLSLSTCLMQSGSQFDARPHFLRSDETAQMPRRTGGGEKKIDRGAEWAREEARRRRKGGSSRGSRGRDSSSVVCLCLPFDASSLSELPW